MDHIYDSLPLIAILVGLAGVVLLVLRKTRGMSIEKIEAFYAPPYLWQVFRNFWDREVAHRFPKEKIESRMIDLAEVSLRKTRLATMKTDYFLSKQIERIQQIKKETQHNQAEIWEKIKNGPNFEAASAGASEEMGSDHHDPAKIEIKLTSQPQATLADYKNLARLYLADNHFSEGRRVLLDCWRKDPADADVLALLDDVRENESKEVAAFSAPVIVETSPGTQETV